MCILAVKEKGTARLRRILGRYLECCDLQETEGVAAAVSTWGLGEQSAECRYAS